MTNQSVRIEPLDSERWDPRLSEFLSLVSVDGTPPSNLFSTLANHPKLFRQAVVPFLNYLANSSRLAREAGPGSDSEAGVIRESLSSRERELLVLRVSRNASAGYMWSHHIGYARAAGITEEESSAIADRDDSRFEQSKEDFYILRAADELIQSSRISDPLWAQLAQRYSVAALIELVFVVGLYQVLALAMNTFGMEVEDRYPSCPWAQSS